MNPVVRHLEVEVEVQPGGKLTLPPALVDSVGAGRWLITVEPAERPAVRGHDGFLAGYAAEDEGLYDDDGIHPIEPENQHGPNLGRAAACGRPKSPPPGSSDCKRPCRGARSNGTAA